MPKPGKNESKEKFISRCMAYPDLQDKPQKQRAGECYGIWHQHHPKGGKSAKSQKPCTGGACGCVGCRKEKALRASVQKVLTLKKQNLQAYTLPAIGVQCSDAEMSATGVLCTSDPDLVGDLVLPEGGDLTHHQLNPVVLLEHNLIAGKWGIGKCEGPQGEYTVELDADRLIQKSFFSQSLPEAKQSYLLIKEGILRGNSMGFKEDHVLPRGGGGRLVENWRLYEVTWTCLPMNPYCLDTLTSIFSKGRLDGESLTLSIKSMLQPWVLPRKFYPTEIKDTHMFLNTKSDYEEDREEKEQDLEEGQPKNHMELEQKSDDEHDEEPEGEKSLKDKAEEQEGKGGEKLLKALIEHLKELHGEVAEAADEVDNERIQACLEDFLDNLDDHVERLEEDLEDEYGGDVDEDDEEGEDDENEKKRHKSRRKSQKNRKSRKSQKSRRSLRRKSQLEDYDDEDADLARENQRMLRRLERYQQS